MPPFSIFKSSCLFYKRWKRLAKPFYSKTILQIVSERWKRLAKPFYSKTILQIVSEHTFFGIIFA